MIGSLSSSSAAAAAAGRPVLHLSKASAATKPNKADGEACVTTIPDPTTIPLLPPTQTPPRRRCGIPGARYTSLSSFLSAFSIASVSSGLPTEILMHPASSAGLL